MIIHMFIGNNNCDQTILTQNFCDLAFSLQKKTKFKTTRGGKINVKN